MHSPVGPLRSWGVACMGPGSPGCQSSPRTCPELNPLAFQGCVLIPLLQDMVTRASDITHLSCTSPMGTGDTVIRTVLLYQTD